MTCHICTSRLHSCNLSKYAQTQYMWTTFKTMYKLFPLLLYKHEILECELNVTTCPNCWDQMIKTNNISIGPFEKHFIIHIVTRLNLVSCYLNLELHTNHYFQAIITILVDLFSSFSTWTLIIYNIYLVDHNLVAT